MAKGEVLAGQLSGEAFLRDFKDATDIASEVGEFESWVLAGDARTGLVERIQQDPVVADEQLAVGGLATLLAATEEQERIQALVEEARRLNIARFLGYKATVTKLEGYEQESIKVAPVANTTATGTIWLPLRSTYRKSRSAPLTTLSPRTGSFRMGEYRSRVFRSAAFYEVYPFDRDTGEPIVDIDFQGPPKKLPSQSYRLWWAANRG